MQTLAAESAIRCSVGSRFQRSFVTQHAVVERILYGVCVRRRSFSRTHLLCRKTNSPGGRDALVAFLHALESGLESGLLLYCVSFSTEPDGF